MIGGWLENYDAAFGVTKATDVLAHISPARLKQDRFAAIDTLKALRAVGRLTTEEVYHWRCDEAGCDLVRGEAPTDDEMFPPHQVRH